MSHLKAFLLNQAREALEKLQKTGVGYIDYEDSAGIEYVIEGKVFRVEITEVPGGERR